MKFKIGDRVLSHRFQCEGTVIGLEEDFRSVTVAHDRSFRKCWHIPGDPVGETCGFVYDADSGEIDNLSAKFRGADPSAIL